MFVWAQVHPFSGFGDVSSVRAVASLGSRGSEESLGHAEWLALTGQAVWSALEPGSTWMFRHRAPWKGRDRGRAVRVAVSAS